MLPRSCEGEGGIRGGYAPTAISIRDHRTEKYQVVVPDEGVEPPSFGLLSRHSATELIRHFNALPPTILFVQTSNLNQLLLDRSTNPFYLWRLK
jgi:hypothetical protein